MPLKSSFSSILDETSTRRWREGLFRESQRLTQSVALHPVELKRYRFTIGSTRPGADDRLPPKQSLRVRPTNPASP
jgi:hypothetical protein